MTLAGLICINGPQAPARPPTSLDLRTPRGFAKVAVQVLPEYRRAVALPRFEERQSGGCACVGFELTVTHITHGLIGAREVTIEALLLDSHVRCGGAVGAARLQHLELAGVPPAWARL
jgi:hypothetical protein